MVNDVIDPDTDLNLTFRKQRIQVRILPSRKKRIRIGPSKTRILIHNLGPSFQVDSITFGIGFTSKSVETKFSFHPVAGFEVMMASLFYPTGQEHKANERTSQSSYIKVRFVCGRTGHFL